MTGPLISFLTDFGLRDPSAAIMRGVVLDIVPDARIVDISHEVRKFAIRDAGVGTARLPIAIATGRADVLIGPDNGLLVGAAARLGGIRAVHVLEAEAYRLPVVSTSFHGRDIFAPAAAHLARGIAVAELGRVLDPALLVPSPIAEAEVRAGELRSSVVYVDTFGNVKLAGLRADLEAALGRLHAGDPLALSIGDRRIDTSWQATFGDVAPGETLVYEDSYRRICLAASQASAAAIHGIVDDLEVIIRRA